MSDRANHRDRRATHGFQETAPRKPCARDGNDGRVPTTAFVAPEMRTRLPLSISTPQFPGQLSANNKHARKKIKRRYKEQRRNRAIYGLCPTLSFASSSARTQLLACRDGSAQLRFRETPIASASQVVSPASARDCRHSDTLLLSSNTPRKASPPLLKGFRWPVLLTCKQHKKTCWGVYRACGMYSASPYTITLPTVSPFPGLFFFF